MTLQDRKESMKAFTKFLMFLMLTSTMLLSSCSKDDEPQNLPYTTEQKTVLATFKGKFESLPDIVSHTTTMTFIEQYTAPKNLIGKGLYDEQTTIEIHGILEYFYSFDTDYLFKKAYYINPNGKDIRMYSLIDNNTINAKAKVEKYKVTIKSTDEYVLYDIDFPLNPETFKRK